MAFTLALTDADKTYCRNIVRWSIATALDGQADFTGMAEPPSDILREELGAFVTLKLGDNLRGCIGNIVGDGPLYKTIARMARSAAFEDPRFPPLSSPEFEQISLEISVLGPIEPCPDPDLIEIGRHGLIIAQGHRQGLLLPQVPVEWGWDRRTFLEHTCAKAGLPRNAWRDDTTRIFWFEAVIF